MGAQKCRKSEAGLTWLLLEKIINPHSSDHKETLGIFFVGIPVADREERISSAKWRMGDTGEENLVREGPSLSFKGSSSIDEDGY